MVEMHAVISKRDAVREARRELVAFGIFLVPLSLLGYWIYHATRASAPLNLPTLPLMWTPGLAAILANLVLHERFAAGSFRFKGRQQLRAIGFGLLLPLGVGGLAYGIAAAGVAELQSPATPFLSAWPLLGIAGTIFLAATLGTLIVLPGALGEEIGWRGYLLPRLIQSGAPQPILLSGLIWGGWHLVPLVITGYAVGRSLALSMIGLLIVILGLGTILAWLRLDTGSIWPSVMTHAAWNATINGGFDVAFVERPTRLWTGETGILVSLILTLLTFLLWHRRRLARRTRRN
jgi:uncharacterized protein